MANVTLSLRTTTGGKVKGAKNPPREDVELFLCSSGKLFHNADLMTGTLERQIVALKEVIFQSFHFIRYLFFTQRTCFPSPYSFSKIGTESAIRIMMGRTLMRSSKCSSSCRKSRLCADSFSNASTKNRGKPSRHPRLSI